jgi:hypothetical protein
MAIKYITGLRKSYAKSLRSNGRMDRAIAIANAPIYSPVLKINEAHPEAEPDIMAYNEMINDTICDFSILNLEFESMGLSMKEIMEDAKLRLDAVKSILLKEKERQQDLNILCNKYSDFSNVIKITADMAEGNFYEEDGVFSAAIVSQGQVDYGVSSIDGNGYEGNKYVYKNESFVNDSIDTSKRSFINDGSFITAYEYSRLTASNSEKVSFKDLNFDSIEARCSITMTSPIPFNLIKFSGETVNVSVVDVFVSDDGIQFTKVLKKMITLNNRTKQYETHDYIEGNGILSFPSTRFLRLSLQSNGYTDDTIAFVKTETVNSTTKDTTVIVPSAKRHVIKIPSLIAEKNTYASESLINISNLISSPVKSIAVFSSEYIPDHLPPDDYVKYTLTINGTEYEIVPINSDKNGKKIIRTTQYDSSPEYVEYLNEDIKSASLSITIKTLNGYATPFISNIKLLVGGN